MAISLDENTILHTVSFADDQNIVAPDINDIKYMTRQLEEEYKIMSLQTLEVNVQKTEYMSIGDPTGCIAIKQTT